MINIKYKKVIQPISFLSRDFEKFIGVRIAEAGVHISRIRLGILHTVDKIGFRCQQDIADWNHVSPQSVYRHLNILIEQGYVQKQHSENDGRANTLTLTPKAKKLIKVTEKIIKKSVEEYFKNLDDAELELLSTLLTKIKPFKKVCTEKND